MHLKIALPLEKKRIENSEESHQLPHVVCPTKNIDNYVVKNRSNHMVKLCGRSRELHLISSSAGVVL